MFDSSFFVAISFLIFVVLVIYMGLPRMIISALDKRSEDIQEELDEARNLREEAQKILAKEKKNLDKAEEESKNLIEKAKQQVDELTKKAEETLKEDIERKKKIAELKIEQAETEALNDVKARGGISEYKLVLDETTTTPDLIDRNIMYAKILLKPTRSVEFFAIDFVITNTGASFDD